MPANLVYNSFLFIIGNKIDQVPIAANEIYITNINSIAWYISIMARLREHNNRNVPSRFDIEQSPIIHIWKI